MDQRNKIKRNDYNNGDPFSEFTHSLLVTIVSFLPMKEAARTSVLSKRWYKVWRDTHRLEFNENYFVKHDDKELNRQERRCKFAKFIESVISGRGRALDDDDVQRFSLVISHPQMYNVDIAKHVKYATFHRVKDLELDFSDPRWRVDDPNYYKPVWNIPYQVYNAQFLQSLKLVSCNFDATKCIFFRALKNLHIAWTPITMSSIKVFLENCPLLESFCLKKCCQIDQIEFSLPNSTLKNFEMERCKFLDDTICFFIEGPKFKYFKYHGKIGHFHLSYQPEMVEADLDFSMENQFSETGELLCSILKEIFAVQTLTVCSVLLQNISSGEQIISLENCVLNVRHLILKTSIHPNEFFGIDFMLNICPKLEILTIDLCSSKIFNNYRPPFEFNAEEFWFNNLIVQSCVNDTLKVVNVKGFKGTRNEQYLLRYLLNFGVNIENINLYISNEIGANGENRSSYIERVHYITRAKRASHNIHIAIL